MENKKNKGSLTVEASLSLVIFIFAFVSVLSLCKFVKAQIVIQHAINRVAMEMSEYTYIINRFSLNRNTTKKEEFISQTDKLIDQAVNLSNVIKQESETVSSIDLTHDFDDIDDLAGAIGIYNKYEDNYHTVRKSYENLSDATKQLASQADTYFQNPKNILKGIMLVVRDNVADYAISKYIMAPICKSMSRKYLEKDTLSADEHLKKLGVENGLDGISFDLSTLFTDGKTINVTAVYNMKINFPFFGEKPFLYKLNASTVGWRTKSLSGITLLGSDESTVESENKKTVNIWDCENFARADEFVKMIGNERKLIPARTPRGIDFYDKNNNEFTYIHSIKTECKSYTQDGQLNFDAIESIIKEKANKELDKINNAQTVTMSDGSVVKIPNKDRNLKVIIVVQKSAENNSKELEQLKKKIINELGSSNLDIEFYYADGLIEVEN